MKTSSRLCNACGMDNPSQAAFCMACGGPMEAGMPIPSNATGLIRQDQLLKQRYRILAQIGRGGFAAVYKAEDSHFYQRLVAVKEMSQSGLSPLHGRRLLLRYLSKDMPKPTSCLATMLSTPTSIPPSVS